MNRTTEIPTATGWYWFEPAASRRMMVFIDSHIVKVWYADNGALLWCGPPETVDEMFGPGEWVGPIEEPE